MTFRYISQNDWRSSFRVVQYGDGEDVFDNIDDDNESFLKCAGNNRIWTMVYLYHVTEGSAVSEASDGKWVFAPGYLTAGQVFAVSVTPWTDEHRGLFVDLDLCSCGHPRLGPR